MRLSFWAYDSGEPYFSVEVAPWKADARLEDGERQLLGAARKLGQAGFQGGFHKGEQVWWTEHKPEAYLDAADVPARLIELIDRDITAIVGSGLLAYDLQAAVKGGRGGPPKLRAKKKP